MRSVLLQLLEDFLSAIVFVATLALTGRLVLATVVAIAIAVVQYGYRVARKQPLSAMQWMALALVIGLGSLTLITNDSRFIRLKPSIAHFAIGTVMLRRGWQLPYMPPVVLEWVPQRSLVAWGYAWAALMMLMGVANIAAAEWLSVSAWGAFLTGLLVGKLLFFFVQYAALRAAVRSRMVRVGAT